MYEVPSVQLLLSSVYLYCLGFRQKKYHNLLNVLLEKAPPVNHRIMWRLFRVILCGTFFNATSVEKLVLYNSMNIAASILHGWKLHIKVHFHNFEYLS